MSRTALTLEPLERERFAPFGDVIDLQAPWFPINQGTTRRYHDLGQVQLAGIDARAGISLAVSTPIQWPIHISMLERHPLGSQAWIPRTDCPFVVVVAPDGPTDTPDETAIRAFYARPGQGVNYHLGVWHHPLLALQVGEFIVVDKVGDAPNCDEHALQQAYVITAQSLAALAAPAQETRS